MDRYRALVRLLADSATLLAECVGEQQDETGMLMDVVGMPTIVIILTNGRIPSSRFQHASDVTGILERAFGHGLPVPFSVLHISEDVRSRELEVRRARRLHPETVHNAPPEPGNGTA